MQGAPIQQAQQFDGVTAFAGIVGLTDNDAGGEDDQGFRMLGGVGQDAARLGQAIQHPVASGWRSNKRVGQGVGHFRPRRVLAGRLCSCALIQSWTEARR